MAGTSSIACGTRLLDLTDRLGRRRDLRGRFHSASITRLGYQGSPSSHKPSGLSAFPPGLTDRHEIIEEVMRGGYLVRSQPSGVIVHEGIVTLTGRPESNQTGRDLIQQVRHIEGVVTVLDRLRPGC